MNVERLNHSFRQQGLQLPTAIYLLPTAFFQCLARDLAVVEVPLLRADDLVILVPLARDDDDVASARLRDGAMYGLAAVNNLEVRPPRGLQTLFNVAQDGLGVFRSRVIGGRYHYITERRGGLSHRRALRAVAVAAAAEDGDDSAARYF